jgi:2-haloacid dehalogenase
LSGIEAVTFDAYGTLLDFSEPDFIVTMAEICGQQGLEADAAEVWRRFLRASYELRYEHHHEPRYTLYYDAWVTQFEMVFKRMRLPGSAEDAADHFKARLASASAFAEAHDVIEALRPHYRLALLSNADDDFLTEALRRNGLEFDIVVTSEQAGAIKPDPAIFLHLAKRMGLAPEAVLYAGYNPVPDVLGPSRAGVRSAWVNRNGMRRPRRVPPPDIRVKSLTELAQKLVPAVE